MRFHNSIRFYRKKIGLKQQELAGKIKIKRSTLSFIENGYRLPGIELLEEIASNLGTTVGQLYPTDIQDLIIKYGKGNDNVLSLKSIFFHTKNSYSVFFLPSVFHLSVWAAF